MAAEVILILLGSPIGVAIILLFLMFRESKRPAPDLGKDSSEGGDDDEGGLGYTWNDVEIDLPPETGQPIVPTTTPRQPEPTS